MTPGQKMTIKTFPLPWQGASVYGGVQDTFSSILSKNEDCDFS